jgi:hypothetical protein
MPNALQAYIATENAREPVSELAIMNLLQTRGICSDLCVWAEDVGNAGECVGWLESLGKVDSTGGGSV